MRVKLVQVFISCRLDYCNSLIFGISKGQMNRLQSVQNATARLVTGTMLPPHIASAPSATLATGTPACRLQGGHTRTPVSAWHFTTVPGRRLPSCRRCSWAATAFHSKPNMRSDADIQHLWRQECSELSAPDNVIKSSVAPERRWQPDISYSEFRRSLKTFLFGQWGHRTAWTVLIAPSRNILTYLLTYFSWVPPSLHFPFSIPSSPIPSPFHSIPLAHLRSRPVK